MNCNNCGHVVKLKAEFCPNCGQRIVMTMDDIIASSHDDLAARRGEEFIGKIRAGIVLLLVALSVVVGFIILYDKKLRFDGAALPGIAANVPLGTGATTETLEQPYTNPRPLPELTPATLRVLGHRRGTLRQQLREANGSGARAYDVSINNGLQWLDHMQEKDGGWPVAVIGTLWPNGNRDVKWGRVGLSSLALLAYLGDGHTWLTDPTTNRSPHADVVRRGVQYVMASQDPETGRYGDNKGDFMYNHGMATQAIAEAAALTGDNDLKRSAAKAVAFILKVQTDRGGWDYYATQTSDSDNISVSAWQVQALAAAREAGIPVPHEVFEKALRFYIGLTQNGRAIYNYKQDDGQDLPSRDGMILMMRGLLGQGPSSPDVSMLAAKLLPAVPKIKPDWGKGWNPKAKDAAERAKYNPYMMFFCTSAMFFVGGSEWSDWNLRASKAIFDMQDSDGAWRANDTYSLQGGAVYSTALSILSLQASHRVLHSVSSATFTRSSGKDE